MQKKVLVGMSGGVDSSCAAIILQKNNYEVLGATLKMFEKEYCSGCGSIHECEYAHSIAQSMGIKHIIDNCCNDFRAKVQNEFCSQYIGGRTPNPCILCNKYIKFPKMINLADSLGCEYISTGHYAKVMYNSKTGRTELKKATDQNKDQTYVLYSLSQQILSRLILPLGDYTKPQIRKIASDSGLKNAQKPDSQDICFIPDGDYVSYIQKEYEYTAKPGNFIDMNGNIIGQHNGTIHYTKGQRKGLGTSFGKAMYVINKNVNTNTVTLSENKNLFSTEMIAENVNLISIDEINKPIKVTAKTRYSQKEAPATVVYIGKNKIHVKFDEPQRAITPGQAVVLYDDDTVIGGGTITEENFI